MGKYFFFILKPNMYQWKNSLSVEVLAKVKMEHKTTLLVIFNSTYDNSVKAFKNYKKNKSNKGEENNI